jgi:hypothetical protein
LDWIIPTKNLSKIGLLEKNRRKTGFLGKNREILDYLGKLEGKYGFQITKKKISSSRPSTQAVQNTLTLLGMMLELQIELFKTTAIFGIFDATAGIYLNFRYFRGAQQFLQRSLVVFHIC